jgi:UDP-N-acetyl-2-amino-2-deoxyglucuronate dehydrogenase
MIENLIRVAVVGCGRVSRTAHYAAIKGIEDFELRAVCDIDKSRADEWAMKNNVKAYYSIEELLEEEPLDLVSINVPNGLHPRLATMAANRGINILCEKPLALRLADADDLIDFCDVKGVKLFSVLQNRFNATNQLLKRAVQKGRFGRLLTVNVTMRWHRSLDYYLEGNGWRGSREMARGAFCQQAIHYIDTMQWLVDAPPRTCFAKMATAVHPVEVETHGCGIVAFANGVIGSLDITCLTYPDDREGSLTLLGETGTVKIGGTSMNRIIEWEFAKPDVEDDALARNSDYEPPTVYGYGHEEMYRRVGAVLRRGAPRDHVPDGREGRKAVALLEGFYESDRTGQVVRFPLRRS